MQHLPAIELRGELVSADDIAFGSGRQELARGQVVGLGRIAALMGHDEVVPQINRIL